MALYIMKLFYFYFSIIKYVGRELNFSFLFYLKNKHVNRRIKCASTLL